MSMESEIKRQVANEIPKWIDLPAKITANILHRLGAVEILESTQLVCTSWYKIYQDPAMWRVIHLRETDFDYEVEGLCRHAVDRSQGQLIQISLNEIGDVGLLNYIVHRSIHLKHLTLQGCCCGITGKDLAEAVKKLPHLEELHLAMMPSVEVEDIETIGNSCPRLKSFAFNEGGFQPPDETYIPEPGSWEFIVYHEGDSNRHARAIAKSMPNLHHLSLICNTIQNEGVEAILDGCPHLESLDLRMCFHIDLEGDLGIRCYEQIKHVKGTFDSVSDIEWLAECGDSDEISVFGSPSYLLDFEWEDDAYDYYDGN